MTVDPFTVSHCQLVTGLDAKRQNYSFDLRIVLMGLVVFWGSLP